MDGRNKALKLGEGNPYLWEKMGITSLDKEWSSSLDDLSELIVGGYNLNQNQNKIRCVVGGVCIYKSQGKIEKLPLSFLLETLNVFIFSSKFGVTGKILLPIAEECHNYPFLNVEFKNIGIQLASLISELSNLLNIKVETSLSKKIRYGFLPIEKLYGLFNPFTLDPLKSAYPLGEINEEDLLKGYESYALRYRYLDNSKIDNSYLIIDGLHLSKSVIIGMEERGQYLVTSPFPSLFGYEHCLLVDSPSNVPILDLTTETILRLEYFNKILKEKLMIDLNDLITYVQNFIKNQLVERKDKMSEEDEIS